MNEAAAVATVEAASNGVDPTVIPDDVRAAVIPDDVRAGAEREIAAMAPDKQRRMIAELEAMLVLSKKAVAKAVATSAVVERVKREIANGDAAPADPEPASTMPTAAPTEPAPAHAQHAPASAPSPAAAPAETAAPRGAAPAGPATAPDPYPDPPHMVESREIAYLWSWEALEKGAYLVTADAWRKAHKDLDLADFRYLVEVKDGIEMVRRFRPLDGFLLEMDGGGESGMPPIFKWLAQQPIFVATASGRIVESRGPTNVVVHACHSLHKLIPLVQFDGVVHARLRLVGWHTALSGAREPMFQLWVEPDEADPRKPKLVSLESALGKSAR